MCLRATCSRGAVLPLNVLCWAHSLALRDGRFAATQQPACKVAPLPPTLSRWPRDWVCQGGSSQWVRWVEKSCCVRWWAVAALEHGVWPHCLFHRGGGMGVWMLQVAACGEAACGVHCHTCITQDQGSVWMVVALRSWLVRCPWPCLKALSTLLINFLSLAVDKSVSTAQIHRDSSNTPLCFPADTRGGKKCFIFWPHPQNYLPKASAASTQNRYPSLPHLVMGGLVHCCCGTGKCSFSLSPDDSGTQEPCSAEVVVREGYRCCWADSKPRGAFDTDESWTGLWS